MTRCETCLAENAAPVDRCEFCGLQHGDEPRAELAVTNVSDSVNPRPSSPLQIPGPAADSQMQYRFTLSTLLQLMTVAAVGCAAMGYSARLGLLFALLAIGGIVRTSNVVNLRRRFGVETTWVERAGLFHGGMWLAFSFGAILLICILIGFLAGIFLALFFESTAGTLPAILGFWAGNALGVLLVMAAVRWFRALCTHNRRRECARLRRQTEVADYIASGRLAEPDWKKTLQDFQPQGEWPQYETSRPRRGVPASIRMPGEFA